MIRTVIRRLATWGAQYFCRFCGAGPFSTDAEGAAHTRAVHGTQ
jgi:hypothetical protein